MSHKFSRLQTLFLALALSSLSSSPVLAKSFELGVQEKQYLDSAPPLNGGASYPAPQMIQQTPTLAPPTQQFIPGNVSHHAPIQGGVSKTLPPGFLGIWNVAGQRTKVEALPEFRAGVQQIFAGNTQNTWTINGNPQSGYTIGSDSGVNFQLWVDKVANGVAFVRYQHPVNNTVAQEAIVMQLGNNGATFTGLERISIIKEVPGQPPVTRCKVQYQLTGQRGR